MEPLERIKIFARFAKDLARLSKCTERQVAAVITDKDMTQVYSIGIKGGAKGVIDCMCKLGSKYGCVHAEINALTKCTSDAKDRVMFMTLSPGVACAAAIVNAPGSFSTVYYLDEWKNTDGINILKDANIKVINLQNVI